MAEHMGWGDPPRRPRADLREVHVWRAMLASLAGRARLGAALSGDERERADAFHQTEYRERYLATRGLLRAILGLYIDVAPEVFTFTYGARGKPAIDRPRSARGLRFNVSHSGGIVLFAVGLDREVGVDVEHLRPIGALEIARRFFQPDEAAALEPLAGAERDRAFFMLWTRKEAVLKTSGEGIGGLETVGLPPAEHRLLDLEPDAGYVGALAAQGADWIPRRWDANRVRWDDE